MNQIQLQALTELKNLRDAQILTDAEFTALKEKILADRESEAVANPQTNSELSKEVQPNGHTANLWITLGIVAFIAIVVILVISINKPSQSDNYDGYYDTPAVEAVEEVEVVEGDDFSY